jgi:kinesin family protein 2/24
MIEEERRKAPKPLNHVSSNQMQICVCVRKRPLFEKEVLGGEMDSVTCPNPKVLVHETKFKVDGITKYIQTSDFNFDNTYSEKESSHDLYKYQIKDLLPSVFKNGVVTLFAYGQTGSGKTFTISAATHDAVHDLFKLAPAGV